MTSAPKVSVIIPVYNTEKYLRQCLDSVVNQTLKDIEIICINDDSTDNSHEILKEYVAKDTRMKVINSKNGGPGGSRNAGLNIAKSDYIMFVDSDDWIQFNTLEIFLNKMLANDVDIVIGEYVILTKDKSLYSTVENEQKWFDKFNIPEGKYKFNGSFLSYCRVVHNKLYKKEIIDKYNMRFPIGLINQDEAFHAIYFSCIENIYHINKKFYNRLVHSNSVMRKREQTGKGVTDIIYDVEYIFDFLVKNNLYNKYKAGFKNLFKLHITAALNRCKQYKIYEQAKRKVKELCIKCDIDTNLFDLQDATKVSVIIPIYNTGHYLRECLDSIVNQSLREIEIICVNDGSTDNSSEILQEYAQKDARVKIINQEHHGAGKAKNIGIENTHGEYLAFIDSDDYISTDYFEALYSIATANKTDIAATSNVILSYIDETFNKNKKMGFDNQRILKTNTEKGQIIITSGVVCNKIYKKFLVEKYKIRFSNIMCTGEDNIFNIIAVITSNLIACTNKAKYFYRQRQGSSVAVKKDIRHFAVLDIYNEILMRVSELNLSSQWSEIIHKRMKLDFGYHFNGFNAELKKEFLNEVGKRFPSSLHFAKHVECQNRK
jgi:glycosyltransferase involved in cell wall biosynthesis